MVEKGLKSESRTVVSAENVAATMGSGDMQVFATPAMVALMENAAMNAVAGVLEPGVSTVGVEMSVSHVKASPVGAEVTASAVLTEIDGRKLTFEVRAWDDKGTIGEGRHVRFIVDRERFLAKLG
ncbi:MAG: thioesterase family protein [Alistipes sp.]|nr:thioesterase family protein [Alistipes sp.]